VVAKHGGRTLKTLDGIGAQLIELPAQQALDVAARALQGEPGVRYAEPNFKLRATRMPSDSSYPAEWGLKNVGQTIGGTPGTPGADISAERAWDITTGSRSIVVGVVDSGIDPNHPDLAANLWSAPVGWDLLGCGVGTHGVDFSSYSAAGIY